MRECIAEKDEVIQNFETRFRKLEENLIENENSLKKVNLEKKTDEVVHKCPSCSFTTTSEQGLKVHRKVHFSKTCSLCEKTFKNKQKFRDHKFEHTNWDRKKGTYSCKECTFIGKNMFANEVHMGKVHASILNCGLCDVEFDKLEDLETHLSTCELYMCRNCTRKETTVSDIKKHVKSLHLAGAIIDHAKICRNDKEQISEKMYWDYEL